MRAKLHSLLLTTGIFLGFLILNNLAYTQVIVKDSSKIGLGDEFPDDDLAKRSNIRNRILQLKKRNYLKSS
jgi:hypothetical protein